MKGKRILPVILGIVLTACLPLSGCNQKKEEALPEVHLSVWCAEEDQELMTKITDAFKQEYADECNLTIVISKESEMSCKAMVLSNPQAAADIFSFASDQFSALYDGGALLEITENTEDLIARNGGEEASIVESAMVDGKLYAYPYTASNGYFLYYNSDYFTGQDIKSLDKMLEIAAKNGKYFSMDMTSGWYLYSFYKGAGLDVHINEDGLTNSCNWNATGMPYSGVEVTEKLIEMASSPGYLNATDGDFVQGIKDGTIIAGVNGVWNATAIEQAWGENYEADKLPSYELNGQHIPMCSFASYKYLGVNRYSENGEWAMKLADWITNEENEMERFRVRGEAPANVKAAQMPEVVQSKAIAALVKQSGNAYLDKMGENYWQPTNILGTIIVTGNKDNRELQEVLDETVLGVTSQPK